MKQSLVEQSGKVGWVAALMRQLLLEVRVAPVGQAARTRVAEMHGRSVGRLEQRLSRDVIEELKSIAVPFCGLRCFETGLGVARGSSFSRVNRLLDTIESAQLGRQRQRRSTESGEAQQRHAGAGAVVSPQASAGAGGVAQAWVSPGLGDLVQDLVSLPGTSPPDGAVALDLTCDVHPGRLLRLWMSRQAEGVTVFGGEGRPGAWCIDTTGRGAVLVVCAEQGCHRDARLGNDWLVARLSEVQSSFEAGKGLPMAWIPLSHVGAVTASA